MMDGFTGRVAAPAKVNLYLHVGPVRADGRHPLDSLVAFAGEPACDWLDFRPAPETVLTVTGEGAAVAGPVPDNLVLRAVSALEAAAEAVPPHAITLEKVLPVAAGLGGGSADAGAVLRTLGPLAGLGEAALMQMAAGLGGDVPACMLAAACRMQGDGDRVALAPRLPPLPALLVNPRIPCPTGPVFAEFDRLGGMQALDLPALPDFSELGVDGVIGWLAAGTGNDLEPAACRLVPEIAGVLETLSGLPGARLARMSGSGASCFTLFADMAAAQAGCDELVRVRPDWWASPVLLG